jgi:RNA polymerase primary sigma factor
MENFIDNIKLLSIETIDEKSARSLLRIYRSKKEAKFKEQIVNAYLNLVISIARSFHSKYNDPNIELEDLIEEGIIGLLKAIDKYKFSKNTSFRIYATYWIKNSIQQYIKEKLGTISQIPTPTFSLIRKWIKEYQRIYKKSGRTPTLKELSEALKISFVKAKKIAYLISTYSRTFSLDSILEDEETTLGEVIADKSLTPEEILSKISSYETLQDVFKKILTPKEAAVIKLRYRQNGNRYFRKRTSYRSLGKMFHLSAEYIRKLERQALLKLKNYFLSSK